MKAVIVHDSKHGNGEQIANTLKRSIEASGGGVTVGHVSSYDPAQLTQDPPDLLIVGSAVRVFMVSRATNRWINAAARLIRRSNVQIAKGAVFVTHGMEPKQIHSKGLRFRTRLAQSQLAQEVYGDWLSAQVVKPEGPLKDGTLQRFAEHAASLVKWAKE